MFRDWQENTNSSSVGAHKGLRQQLMTIGRIELHCRPANTVEKLEIREDQQVHGFDMLFRERLSR